MDLRPYQREMLSDIHAELAEHQAVCAVLPTGGGKTVIFSSMGAGVVARGKTAWFLAHREELVEQMSEKLLMFDVPHGFIRSNIRLCNSAAKVGMIQTARNRLDKLEPPDLLVIDEAHHTPARAYAELVAAMPPTTSIVGFTATPQRLDGKGLGYFYSSLVSGPSTAELISLGFLVPPRVHAPELVDTSKLHIKMGDFNRAEAAELIDKPSITGDAVEHYKRFAMGTAAVAFCVSIDHAVHVANKFNKAGIPSISVDGSLAKEERKRRLDAFRDDKIKVLTSCDLISEGFDLPKIETAILLRPTNSLGLYLQQVGRALRPAPGKEHAVVLDHVQNWVRHGLPAAEREWKLDGMRSRKKKTDPDNMVIHTCPDCFHVYEGNRCPLCPKKERGEENGGREIEERDGELVEITTIQSWLTASEVDELRTLRARDEIEAFAARVGVTYETARNVLIGSAKTLDDLAAAGRALGYKPNWAHHRFEARKRGRRNA